jgi:alanine racemase
MPQDEKTTWIEVNLAAVQRNIGRLKHITGKPVMAVVKANAYGHGLVEVSRVVVEAGVICLCVARIEEALRIREAGIRIPILVMGYVMPDCITSAISNSIDVMVNSLELAKVFNEKAKATSHPVNIHVKVDSGMHRLGLLPDEIEPFISGMKHLHHLNVEGIFTHFPNADDLNDQSTFDHIAYFSKIVQEFSLAGIKPKIIHAANSAASLYYPSARFDAIRPGIAIYGLHPDIVAPLPGEFEPALTWKGRITSIKNIPGGEGVGYNYRYHTMKNEKIGVASCGYADGLRRSLGNIALLNGRRIHQVGGMCMDQSLWQLDGVPGACIGDEIVFVGRQEQECIRADEVGQLWGSNNYDVVCGLAARIPRVYIYD